MAYDKIISPHITLILLTKQDRSNPHGNTRSDEPFIKKLLNLNLNLSQL